MITKTSTILVHSSCHDGERVRVGWNCRAEHKFQSSIPRTIQFCQSHGIVIEARRAALLSVNATTKGLWFEASLL